MFKKRESNEPQRGLELDSRKSLVEACDVQPAEGNPFTLQKVIFDQGIGGFSIAVGAWDSSKGSYRKLRTASEQILAMRWNGASKDDPGYPAIGTKNGERLNAKWFPLPDEMNDVILEFVAKHSLDYLLEKHALRDMCNQHGKP